MSKRASQDPPERDEPTLPSARPVRRASEALSSERAEPTTVDVAPPPQLTNDTDEFDLPRIEAPIDFDERGQAKGPMFQRPRSSRPTNSRPLSPIDSFGREVESFGASVVGFWRAALAAVRQRLKPVREHAIATWSKLRGGGVKEFEQRGEDTFDRKRARQWESFNRGRTSSSYLQDTERRDQ